MTRTLPIAFTLALLAGCSPMYVLKAPPSPQLDQNALGKRLADYLTSQGVQSLGGPNQALSGPIGLGRCGLTAEDRQSFGRFWQDRWGSHRLFVHEFTCDDTWYAVIVSSNDREAESEARQLRNGLKAMFATEIASGALQIKTKCRVALE
jgi:hypothetical protein